MYMDPYLFIYRVYTLNVFFRNQYSQQSISIYLHEGK
jgi:hypothetical protein